MARKRSLEGKVVAITGAARGIGKATAKALTGAGAKVGIGDLDLELAKQTAQELGPNARAYALDVVERDSFSEFLDGVERDLGPIDVVVNNAGIMLVGWPFSDEDDPTTKRMVDINLWGVMHGTKLALERMKPRNTGHIVNIASQAGNGGFPGGATYCATKFAVRGLSEAVRGELHNEGLDIEISCVMPAVVNTELGASLGEGRFVKVVEPEDVADAILRALRRPYFDVHVPRSTALINSFFSAIPRRGREAMARALKADTILWDADHSARAGYEQRAQRSDPNEAPVEGGDAAAPAATNGAADGVREPEKQTA
jgi:NADP-dependent 3-hydroxy acid dehydrogenase YdfG